ncbi:Gfo/Idh/MocA family protein [Nitrospira moscoviensis]|uniref:Putative Oxidoreductase, Gfo/Idh/MocA family n=1 Tax=Nitrospira moscoviensis TaxID=42253 RepID=A0A0K2GG66_NITMO|nr:Gfo/Idh/MocA family oxidoreductase [Nitrospira moscoviensis]ALA59926.1 putative Oxidoreductase, Gfo/Idh/MocA family [Nitrospira moscoviensis]
MVKLRAGVIGVGHLGQHHARLYATLPDSLLVGVTDQNLDRAKAIADRHGAQVFAGLSDLLKQVDVVSVAVPTSGHYAVAKACLEAKKHVLVEKPVAVQPAEAQELVALAVAHDRRLQVGHSERFNPIMLAMRPHIGTPAFIEGHRLSSFSERGTDVDVVLDLMIHDIDLVLSFNPGSVEEVRAAGVPVLSSTVDIANARIQFSSGCVANLTASRVSLNKMRRLRLFQRDSYVSIDFQSRQGMVSRRSAHPGRRPSIELEEFKGGDEEPLKLQLESFLQAVKTGGRPVVSGEDGAAALEVAHEVLKAITQFAERHVGG